MKGQGSLIQRKDSSHINVEIYCSPSDERCEIQGQHPSLHLLLISSVRVSYLCQEFLAPSKMGVGDGETVNRVEERHTAPRVQKANNQIQGSINICSRVFLITHLPA